MGFKILIVEDSKASRDFIASTVESIPEVQAFTTHSGFEALKLLPRHRFDLIITDINMPLMDGLKLIRHIRQTDAYRTVPIVVITTESAVEDRDRAMALGASAYLVKPVQSKVVQDTVKSLLRLE